MGFNKMVEPGEVGDCGDEALPDKGGGGGGGTRSFSHADKTVIKELKEKNYICHPSDKGTEFCVIQQDNYTQIALAHLSDSNTYQKVPRMSAKTVENKVTQLGKTSAYILVPDPTILLFCARDRDLFKKPLAAPNF